MAVRERASEAATMAAGKKILQDNGLKEEAPAALLLNPALDIVLGAPGDVPHADIQGLGRLAQDLLIVYLLNNTPIQRQYANQLSKLVMPAGWKRLQNPLTHRLSWSLSEQARAMLLTPIVLRPWLCNEKMRTSVVAALEKEFKAEIDYYRYSPLLTMKAFHPIKRLKLQN